METLINLYWHKYKNYRIVIHEPNQNPYSMTLEESYQKLADQNNEDAKTFNFTWHTPESAQSLFVEFIDRIKIKIYDEKYVCNYMVMRMQTYYLYSYYTDPQYVNPWFEIYDKDYLIETIQPNMWRWWVEEMGY